MHFNAVRGRGDHRGTLHIVLARLLWHGLVGGILGAEARGHAGSGGVGHGGLRLGRVVTKFH